MNDCVMVELDDNDLLYHTHIDYENCTLRLTQISIVAPHTIQRFKDAGWTVEEGVLMGKDDKPVPIKPPILPRQSSEQKPS